MAEIKLSTWGIKNPIPVALFFSAAVLAGLLTYGILPIKQFPNIVFPGVAVTISENGAAPGEMETQITRPIEDAMAGISNVKSIQSVVTQGVSTTVIQFELSEDLQKVTDEVRQKVDQTRAILPPGIDPPQTQRLEIDSQPIVTYAVSAPNMSPAGLSWFIDDTVARTLQAEKGVAQVSRVGGVDREINIIIDPDRMASQGLNAATLNTALAAFDTDYPGGRLRRGRTRADRARAGCGDHRSPAARPDRSLRPAAGSSNCRTWPTSATAPPSRAGFARLTRPAGDRLSGAEDQRRQRGAGRGRGQERKRSSSSQVGTTRGSQFTKIFSTVDDTRASYRRDQRTMLEGMALASLVVLIFLRDWRATAITAIAMPVSLIPTLPDDGVVPLQPERGDPAGADPGDRHPGRRRHRRDREHPETGAGGTRPTAPRWRAPTRSAWRSSPPPRPSWWCSPRSRSCPDPGPVLPRVRPDRRGRRCCSRCWWRGC